MILIKLFTILLVVTEKVKLVTIVPDTNNNYVLKVEETPNSNTLKFIPEKSLNEDKVL